MTAMIDYLNPFGDPSIKGKIVQVKKRKSGLEYCVYLPPDYTENTKYPILYHLHGAGALYSWMKREVLWIATQLEAADVKMIVAAPHDPTFCSMWVDGESIDIGRQLREEFIPEIESAYSIKAERSSRFLQGFAMGGFGAALHGYKHQDKFGKIVLWDGDLHDWETLTETRAFIAKDQFANERDNFDLESPWAAARAAAEVEKIQETPVLMFTGSMKETDRYGKKYNALLLAHGANLTYVETQFPHSLKPFLHAHGKEAIEFLMM